MKLVIFTLALLAGFVGAADKPRGPDIRPEGLYLNRTPNQPLSLYGVPPVVQRTGSAQAALTDSTTGTPGTTLNAGAGVQTLSIPVNLAAITTNADVLTAFTPGFKFKLLSVSFAIKTPATTSGKLTTLSLKINSTAVTGGAVALTSANATPLGAIIAGSAITAANTGSSSATISVVSTSTTAFVEGEGYLLIKVQNMDTADAVASQTVLLNELRASLVALGAIAGQ